MVGDSQGRGSPDSTMQRHNMKGYDSGNELNELLTEMAANRHLIKDEDWYNIPAPVRTTCDGIINFTESLASKMINNASKSNDKVR